MKSDEYNSASSWRLHAECEDNTDAAESGKQSFPTAGSTQEIFY